MTLQNYSWRLRLIWAALLISAMTLGGCRRSIASPVDLPTSSPTHPPVTTIPPTLTASATPIPTATPSPTVTPTPLPTATPTSIVLVEQATAVPAELEEISVTNAYAVSGLARLNVGNLTDLDWAPDGESMALASYSSISVIEALSRTEIAHLDTPTGVISVDFSPRGNLLAVGHRFGSEEVGYAGNVDVWRVSSWEALGPILGGRQAVSQVAFSPDGKSLAAAFTSAAYDDNRVVFWDTVRWEISGTLSTGGVQKIAFSPDSKLLAISPDRYAVKVRRTVDGRLLHTLHTSFTGAVNCMAFSPNGATLATGHYDGEIRLWNIQTAELILVLKTDGVVESLDFNPDGTLLASGEGIPSNAVRLWDVEIAQLVRTLEGHEHPVVSLSFSPNGRILASGSYEGSVWLWGVRP